MARYGKTASKKVEKAMHEKKQGKLRSGRSKKKVTSRKQAIAIGLSEARREGGKVPSKKSKRTAGRSKSSRGSAKKRSSAKSSAKRSSTGSRSTRRSSSRAKKKS
jgi:uncharacterized protein DUF6496